MTVDQNRMMWRAGHRRVAVPQQLRRVLRQVWNRSRWGSAMTRRWRLLLRRLDEGGKTVRTSQGREGVEDKS